MDQVAVTSAPEAAPSTALEAPSRPPPSRLRQLMAERFPETPKATDAPSTAAEVAPKSDADAEPEAPKPEPQRLELKLAREQTANKKLVAEVATLKETHATVAKELESVRAEIASNPFRALEKLTGKPIQEIFEAAAKGDYDDRTPQLDPELKAKLDYLDQLKAKEAEREAREAEAQKAQARQAEMAEALPRVKALIEQDAAKYPYLAAVAQGAEAALDDIYAAIDAGETPDVQAVFAKVDREALNQAGFWFKQKAVIQRAVAADPEIRAAMLDALGLDKLNTPTPQTAPKVPFSSVSSLVEVASRKDAPTRDKHAEILEEWSRIRKSS